MNLLEETSSENHDNGKNLKYVKNPLNFDHLGSAEMQEPPLLGQHTEEVLSEVLKYS